MRSEPLHFTRRLSRIDSGAFPDAALIKQTSGTNAALSVSLGRARGSHRSSPAHRSRISIQCTSVPRRQEEACLLTVPAFTPASISSSSRSFSRSSFLLGAFKVVQVVWRETVADAPSPQERVVQRP